MIRITEHGQNNKGFYCSVEDESKEGFKMTIYDDSEEEAIKAAKKFISSMKK